MLIALIISLMCNALLVCAVVRYRAIVRLMAIVARRAGAVDDDVDAVVDKMIDLSGRL